MSWKKHVYASGSTPLAMSRAYLQKGGEERERERIEKPKSEPLQAATVFSYASTAHHTHTSKRARTCPAAE